MALTRIKPRRTTIITALCSCSLVAGETKEPVRVELNGLRVVMDPSSGDMLELEHEGMKLLEAGAR
jgi:hypothetical protein